LLGAVVEGGDVEGGGGKGEGGGSEATFVKPLAIGAGATFTPRASGTLYLRVNDSAANLGDNRGALTIVVED